jgi:hypothetical protein
MYFMNDYLNELYFEKVAKKQKKNPNNLESPTHKVKGIFGTETHLKYDKKTRKQQREAYPILYSGLGGVGGIYMGNRMADYAVEGFKKQPNTYLGKKFRNSAGLRYGTKGVLGVGTGVLMAQKGHHIGKAVGAYSEKHGINV